MALPARGQRYESVPPPEFELPTAVARILAQDTSVRAAINRRLQPRVLLSKLVIGLVLVSATLLVSMWMGARHWQGSLRGSSPIGVAQELEVHTPDFCSEIEEDTEYHTQVPLYWVDDISSAAMCCAECDGDPECGAWTWGGLSDVEGLSKRCFLKKLHADEVPKRFNRTGVSSGLPGRTLQKHGIVAGMLASHHFRTPVPAAPLTDAEETTQTTTSMAPGLVDTLHDLNTTCPGNVSLRGLGELSVVGAKWLRPGKKATGVVVPEEGWEVVPSLNSRAYLAQSCRPDHYERSDYVNLKLLGRTLRYTTDLAGAGCGCGVQLHLAAMRSNSKETKCKDYSCGGTVGCATCLDLALQDANKYAWSSSFTSGESDNAHHGIGYGGGGKRGRRSWNSTEYGPGGLCVDTAWPFEVTISFVTDKEGSLDKVKFKLSQEDKPCTLAATLDQDALGGERGVKELSEAMEEGLTPVFSYSGSTDMGWLDGVDEEGWGPCVDETPQACRPTSRFYDFAVLDGNESNISSEPKGQTLAQMAIELIHKHTAQEARKQRKEQLDKVVAMRLISDSTEPCDGDCDDHTGTEMLGRLENDTSEDGEHWGSEDSDDYEESASGNAEWEVVCDLVHLRSEPSFDGDSLGVRRKADVLVGKRQGGWIRLRRQPGFVPILGEDENRTAQLKERIVTYEKIVTGTCKDHGLYPIEDPRVCEVAAFTLGYFDLNVSVFRGSLRRPEGCYVFQGKLFISSHSANMGHGVTGGRFSLCSSGQYPITTTSTTSTTTSTTVSTTTTTTWGFPSLFCFEVMMRHSYEYGLVRRQIREKAGIFNCDEYAVFSQDGPFSLGHGPYGGEVKAQWFKKAFVGKSEDGTAGNALLFIHVFQAIKKDGRYKNHHWTIKADPDAVVLPWRLRERLRPHTNQLNYLVNCNKVPWKPPFPMIFGALEAYSNQSLQKLYSGGMEICKGQLPWPQWGEDKFMGNCMQRLGVQSFNDFQILADNRCTGAYCANPIAGAFHDFKTQESWFNCWHQATQ